MNVTVVNCVFMVLWMNFELFKVCVIDEGAQGEEVF